jgi:hypothetical protein
VLIFPATERTSEAQDVRLAFTQDAEGRPVLPGFTREYSCVRGCPGGGPYAKAPRAGFLPSFLAGPFVGLVLNPGSQASAFVDRRALELLASGHPRSESVGVEDTLVTKWQPAKEGSR